MGKKEIPTNKIECPYCIGTGMRFYPVGGHGDCNVCDTKGFINENSVYNYTKNKSQLTLNQQNNGNRQ